MLPEDKPQRDRRSDGNFERVWPMSRLIFSRSAPIMPEGGMANASADETLDVDPLWGQREPTFLDLDAGRRGSKSPTCAVLRARTEVPKRRGTTALRPA
jgi:hypothetical protein